MMTPAMNWSLVTPELFYMLCAFVFLGMSLSSAARPRRDYRLSIILAAVGLGVCLNSAWDQGTLFAGVYRVDLFSQVFKVLLAFGLFLVLTLCSELEGIARRHHAEFYLLLFTCTLALMLLVSAVNLLCIYLSLELSSYCLYILVSLRKDRKMALEAGLKYFLVGISASAVMLFGLGLLYGATGALSLSDLARLMPAASAKPVVMVGLMLSLSGFLFKLALCPFHVWAPDVYQGGANQVSAYIATVSKVAAAAILVRVLTAGGAGSGHLTTALAFLSIATMTLGNLAAIAQKDLKRLLAYSSIAHAGYILIGLLSGQGAGQAGVIFYAVSLLVMKITVFLVVIKVAANGENPSIADLAGLHRRAPVLALALLVALFSLAGLPPFIGFTAKFLIFTAAMKAGFFGLVLVAMINVVISLYYYLQVLKAAYFLPEEDPAPPLPLSPATQVTAIALILLMIVGGLYPAGLLHVADAAARALM